MSIRYKGKRFLAALAAACMIFGTAPVQRVMASPAEDGAKAPAEAWDWKSGAGFSCRYLSGRRVAYDAGSADRRPEYVVFTAD